MGLGNSDDMVDTCSGWYTGGQIAGAGLGLAMGDGEGVEAGVVEDLGEEGGVLCEGGCFVAGTQIQMADGSTKSIDKIKVGDEVKSRDPATGKDKNEPVLRLYIHPAPQIMELHLSDGEVITCTPEHRFYVPGKGFEEAGTLSDGDRLVHDADATAPGIKSATITPPLTISDITWDTKATSLSTATTVYNFEVASTHTYFVGSELGGVWVHNDCGSGGSPTLDGDPYSPAAVESRILPPYSINPKHVPGSGYYSPGADVLPPDAEEAYGQAEQSPIGTWWAKGQQGWYRYFPDNTGSAHYSGTIFWGDVPVWIRRGWR